MFKKILWILIIILTLLALIGVSYYIAKSNGLLSVADASVKCQDTACCKNAGYDYFDTPLNSCYSSGDLDYSSSGGGDGNG
jgi:hypothetical protein